ncbi:amino acid permease-associated region [Hymenobacter roseosalivarius DSM 11622]|uniref:Amino acid permease-associated region n=1 Tax=Hymenobacter roseosalivarius DSM 11622 TaxID=645990 RepID=A0A1W1URD0_9BACT|nr:amino acid permease [Hymenobacter roseosalivarius]SMB83688.1 amino acid permease-associated region [Hymenobacter roseosalivarius DSM 11622]
MDNPARPTSASGPTLIRAVGLFTGIFLVAGVVIGSGVFKKIVPLAQTGLSEAWIVAAWVLAGLITICGALNLAGLSSLTEESGGVYEYLRLSFGNFASFLFGWSDFTIIGTASVAALAFIFAQTINTLLPLPNPLRHLEQVSIGQLIYPFADSGIKILAIGTIGVLTWVNYRGVAGSGKLSNVFTAAKIMGILLLIILGLFMTTPTSEQTPLPNLSTAAVADTPFFNAFFGALLSVFWAYDGWMDLSFVTGEIKNPTRNVPRAILLGVSIAIGLYVLVNYAYLRVLPLPALAAVSPNEIGAAVVAEAMLGKAGKTWILVLIMISVFGSLNTVLLSHSRIYFRMAQERFFFAHAGAVHQRYRTPHVALLFTFAWSCLLVISGTFERLTDLVIFGNFLFYGMLAAAVLKMKRQGKITVPVTGYPIIQFIILLFAFALVVNTLVTQPQQSMLGLALMLTSLPFYFYFKRKRA